jgi:hypothetical protein
MGVIGGIGLALFLLVQLGRRKTEISVEPVL